MIKLGHTDQKGNPKIKGTIAQLKQRFYDDQKVREIATLKKNAHILEDNGETRPKKAFWKKKNLKT